MAVTKLTMSGFKPNTFNKYDDFLAGNAAYDPAATWLIATTTLSADQGWVEFTGIPSTYTSLQLRITGRCAQAVSSASAVSVILNGDQTSSYSFHNLKGDGASATANGSATVARADVGTTLTNSYTANIFGVAIIDLHDYASTTRYKTLRSFSGYDSNGAGTVNLGSGLWQKTAAVTSFAVSNQNNAQNWLAGSKFSLYGMIGA